MFCISARSVWLSTFQLREIFSCDEYVEQLNSDLNSTYLLQFCREQREEKQRQPRDAKKPLVRATIPIHGVECTSEEEYEVDA